MKISVNDQPLFQLSEVQCKVICNDISDELFEVDMKRRVHYILSHKYERCLERLKQEWMPKLKAAGVSSIPLDDEEFAKLVFSQPDYKCRSARMDQLEKDAEAANVAQMSARIAQLQETLK